MCYQPICEYLLNCPCYIPFLFIHSNIDTTKHTPGCFSSVSLPTFLILTLAARVPDLVLSSHTW